MFSLSTARTPRTEQFDFQELTRQAAVRMDINIKGWQWSEELRGYHNPSKTDSFAPLTNLGHAFDLMTHCRLEPRFMTRSIQILEVCDDDVEHKMLEHPIGSQGLSASLREALVRAAAIQYSRKTH